MVAEKESFCLNVIEGILKDKYGPADYCFFGRRECAVCIDRRPEGWVVYQPERSVDYDTKTYHNIVEAGLDFLGRVGLRENGTRLKEEFLDRIIAGAV